MKTKQLLFYISFFLLISLCIQLVAAETQGSNQQRKFQEQKVKPIEKIERNIVYATVGKRKLLLDIYLPIDAEQPSSVVIWVHGGAWLAGSKGSGGQARPLVGRGFAVVDVEYRLTGEAIFPAQIQDCRAAVRWVRANAEKYNLDPDNIGAWGDSAGGHLVALMGTAGDVKEFDTKDNSQYSSRIQAVCDWYGPSDVLQMDEHRLNSNAMIHNDKNSPESLLVGGPIQEEPYRSICRKVNPITFITKDDPPFLIMHGDKDVLVPHHQSQILYDALKKTEVEATYYVVKGGNHGLWGGKESHKQLFEMVAEFFEKHLKKDEKKAQAIK